MVGFVVMKSLMLAALLVACGGRAETDARQDAAVDAGPVPTCGGLTFYQLSRSQPRPACSEPNGSGELCAFNNKNNYEPVALDAPDAEFTFRCQDGRYEGTTHW